MTKLWPLVGLWLILLAAQAVPAQTLSADRQSLVFTAAVGGPPTSLPLNITSSPSGAFVLAAAAEPAGSSVTWLSVSPAGGSTPVALTVTVNPANLPAGAYTGSVVASTSTPTGFSSVTVPVTLTVSAINVNPTSLSFQTSVGLTPLAQSVALSTSQALSFNATVATAAGGDWLIVSPPFAAFSNGLSVITAIPNAAVVPLLSPAIYNGTITITPTSGSSLTPVLIPVTLTVTPAPAVTVTPAAVDLEYQVGGGNNITQQVITLTTPSAQGVAFTTTATSQTNPSGGVWVTATPPSGTVTPGGTPVILGYNAAANLPAGTYMSTVTVNTPNGSPASTNVPVNLVVSTLPLLNVPATALNFSYELGSASPPAQSVAITTTSSTAQSYSVAISTSDGASWLSAPATGNTASPLSISVNPAGLAPATYTGTVTVTGVGTGNGAQQISVSLTVSNDPSIVTNFTTLALPYEQGQPQAVSQIVTVQSGNGVPLHFSATATTTNCGNWLTLSGASGATPGVMIVGINPAGLMAGTCTGAISIVASSSQTGAAAINSPFSIPVTLTVSGSSLLVVTPLTPAVFTAQAGGTTLQSEVLTLSSTDSGVLNFSVASQANGGGSWLEVSATNGSTASSSNTVGITVVPGQLAPGTYSGSVTLTATGSGGVPVANSPLTIPVTFVVTAGTLVLSPTSLTFQQSAGGFPPANQPIGVSSTGQALNFVESAFNSGAVNWLSASPTGTTPGSVSVGVNGAGLEIGTYSGLVTVTSLTPNTGNSPAVLPVTLVVNAGTISASPTSLVFTQVQGGQPPVAQNVNISGVPGAISFQAAFTTSTGGAWLGISPGSGTTPSAVQVYIAANNLAAGSYSGSVTVTAANAAGSPIAIPVTLNVLPAYSFAASPTTVTFNVTSGSTAIQTASLQISSAAGPAAWTVTSSAGWLGVTPSSGSTPATVTVSANPTGLAQGAYSAAITITSPNALTPLTVTVNLVVGTVAPPVFNSIKNAASYATGSVAPGENVALFGSGIGPPQLTPGTVTNGVVDTSVAATRVLFDGIPSPVIYALSNQTSVMVPYEIVGRSTVNIVVEYQGVQSSPIAYTVAVAVPGIYTQNSEGFGPGSILNPGYSINLPSSPAPKGSVVSVYMTGEGYTDGAVDGAIATGTLSPVLPVTATVGGIPATVTYAGTSPGIVTGAMQANIQIPQSAPSGPAVPIVITVGSGSTALSTQAGVTVAVQ